MVKSVTSADARASARLAALGRSVLDYAEPVEPQVRRSIDEGLRRGTTDAVVHAAALWMAFDAGADLRLNRSLARGWLPGLHELIHSGHLDAASYALPKLKSAYPQMRYLENMDIVFKRLPHAVGRGREPFLDDRTSDVQVVEMPGAETMIIGFCGGSHQLGMPINLLDRWLAQTGSHVIYLRDRKKIGYAEGIPTLGDDMASTIDTLRHLAGDVGARRIVCLGHSAGATGALRFARTLGAERVLALSPITGGAEYEERISPHLPTVAGAPWVDLVPLYRDGGGVRAHIVYGEQHEGDRQQCVRMAGLRGITVEALADCESHHIMGELLRAGRLEKVIHWLMSGDESSGLRSLAPPVRPLGA